MWLRLRDWVWGLVGLVNQLVGVASWSGAFDSVLGWIVLHPLLPPLMTVVGTILVYRWYQRVGAPAIARACTAAGKWARGVFMAVAAAWHREQLYAYHHRGFMRVRNDEETPAPTYCATRHGISLTPPWSDEIPDGEDSLRVSCAFAVPGVKGKPYTVLEPYIKDGWGVYFSGPDGDEWHGDRQAMDIHARYRLPAHGSYSPIFRVPNRGPIRSAEWRALVNARFLTGFSAPVKPFVWEIEPIDLSFVNALRVVVTMFKNEGESNEQDYIAEAEFSSLSSLVALPSLDNARWRPEEFDYDAHPARCFLTCTVDRNGGRIVMGRSKPSLVRGIEVPLRFMLAFHLADNSQRVASWLTVILIDQHWYRAPPELMVYWRSTGLQGSG